MSTVIKGGTIVAADRTYKADVLIEGEKIAAIGENLKGDEAIDAAGAYIMPGGIDPHTHLEMPFMGTTAAETWESGTFAALRAAPRCWSISCMPGPDGAARGARRVGQKGQAQASSTIRYHMAINGWSKKHLRRDGRVVKRGINTFKHFMAYKGALMVNDDEMFASFQRCAAARRAAACPCRERRHRRRAAAEIHERGRYRPRGARLFAAAGGRGRGDQPRDHDRRRGGGARLHRARAQRAGARGDPAGAQKGMRVYGEPLIQHLTLDESEYFNGLGLCGTTGDVAAVPRQGHQDSLWAGLAAGRCRWWRPTIAPSPPSRSAWG